MRFVAFFEVPEDKLDAYFETWKERRPKLPDYKVKIPPHSLPEPFHGITGFMVFESKGVSGVHWQQIKEYLSQYTALGIKVKLLPIWEDAKLGKELRKFRRGQQIAAKEWNKTKYPKIRDWGATQSLKILPLLDWHTSYEELRIAPGVSYLIITDETTILFDVGFNPREEDPSPLLHNMNKLGVTIEDFDTIVISHNHGDHTGGVKFKERATFSITAKQIPLPGKKVYTPVPMTYPGLHPTHTKAPTVLAKGVATIGTISNAIFLIGKEVEPEQALAINVAGKGIVLVVGCGHQTLPKIIERTESLFDESIYGLIGGLHYPVEGGPIEILGMSPYKYLGTGKVPWRYISRKEVQENIALLKKRSIQVIGVSPHDSSSLSLKLFREAFSTEFRDIKVGEEITI